ncbi:MAG: hypothetical protein BYD32DRAFT_198195 [Podila humilis]|nr:MAG: hypothetical protein BYD32DRAFT_198195 [Podila humilis]
MSLPFLSSLSRRLSLFVVVCRCLSLTVSMSMSMCCLMQCGISVCSLVFGCVGLDSALICLWQTFCVPISSHFPAKSSGDPCCAFTQIHSAFGRVRCIEKPFSTPFSPILHLPIGT